MDRAQEDIMRTPSGVGFTPGQMSTLKMLIHLPNFIKLYTRLWADKRVSTLAKSLLVIGIAYVLMPFDALTDFLIPLGWMDDMAVMGGALWLFVKMCPRRVVEEHVEIIDEGG
ncbi:MAG: YkvA family protein [Armatimonadota bacterium]